MPNERPLRLIAKTEKNLSVVDYERRHPVKTFCFTMATLMLFTALLFLPMTCLSGCARL